MWWSVVECGAELTIQLTSFDGSCVGDGGGVAETRGCGNLPGTYFRVAGRALSYL